MNLHKLILTENDCYKAGEKITPKGIMVHSTGANNPTLRRYVGPDDGLLGVNQYGNHWNRTGTNACVHAFIGKLADGSIATYQTLPWDYRGWHAGASANNTHIGFEICEDGLTDAVYFGKVYKEAVELCAYLCKLYGLTEKDILCHSEGYKKGVASNHSDVMHWFPKHGKSMDTFRADVKALLVEAETETLYRVQIGAFHSKKNAEDLVEKAKAAGFSACLHVCDITANDPTPTPQPEPVPKPEPVKEIKVGSKVRLNKGAKTYSGGSLASFVYDRVHEVTQLNGDRVVIAYNGTTVAAVNKNDLSLVE